MKVYISGKIGEKVISDKTRRKFAAAEEMLRSVGFEVFNPTDLKWAETLQKGYEREKKANKHIDGNFPEFYGYALLRDLMVLSSMDVIYMLEDWPLSPGAKAERAFALATGKRYLCENHFDAREYLGHEMKGLVDAGRPPGCWLAHNNKSDAIDEYMVANKDRVWLPLKREGEL